MRRPFFALLAIAALTLAATACADWSEEDLTFFLDELAASYPIQEPGKPLSESSNQDVQAAAKAPEMIEKEREAQRLVNEAITTKNPDVVAEARQLQPYDMSLRFYQMALLIALDRQSDARESMAEITGILYDRDYGGVDSTFTEFAATSLFLQALFRTMTGFDAGSPEWTRLNDTYCHNLAGYRGRAQALEQELGTRASADRFSAATCP